MSNISYTYAYCDPRKPGIWKTDIFTFFYEPFYIGEGKNARINAHMYYHKREMENKPTHKTRKIAKILASDNLPIIFKLADALTPDEALAVETSLIDQIGTHCIIPTVKKRGPLTNLQINRGKKFIMSEESVKRRTLKNRGKKRTEQTKNLLSDSLKRYHSTNAVSEETRAKISAVHKGKTISLEDRQKISAAGIINSSREWKITFESDGSSIFIRNLKQWCADQNLSVTSVKRTSHFYKGVRAERIN